MTITNTYSITPPSVPIVVHFADGSKVTVKLSPSDLTSDLLESVKDKLRSSAAQLWLVDVDGLSKWIM